MRDFAGESNDCPIDPELFLDLYRIAGEALAGRRREIPPDAELCLEDKRPGIRLTDVPMNQMGFAVIRECKRRVGRDAAERVSLSFLIRWNAIHEALMSRRIDEFARECEDGEFEMHDSVLVAAAQCPLDGNGDFDPSFEIRVRRLFNSD